MGFEHLRLLLLATCLLAAGALARDAGAAARSWVGVGLLFIAGLLLAWPMAKAHRDKRLRPQRLPPEPALPADSQRLNLLLAQVEHLPVAAWCLGGDGRLQALSARARQLVAPGSVRDPAALQRLLRAAERSGPQTLETERGSERWALQRQALSFDGQALTLLVLLPLESQLETESLLAWQQLLRILTHEIMNSLTPIKSLSQTAQMLLDEPPLVESELRLALDGINQRAEGLSSFVANYRRVSQWPAPVLAPVDIGSLLQRLRLAATPAWVSRGGAISVEVAEPGLRLLADEGQREQVLLSLISNAEQATAEVAAPRLWLQARQGRGGRLQISVRDNGPGVPAGLERKIFLPFFSAREGGQGIGLTVVRALLHGMGGRVRLVRPLEGGAAFVVRF